MSDEQTPTNEQPKIPVLPDKIQLEELEHLRLAAANEKLRRLVTEHQLGQMEAAQAQAKLAKTRADVEESGKAQEAILNDLGEKYQVGASIRRYDINIATGECTLRKPQATPQPPKG